MTGAVSGRQTLRVEGWLVAEGTYEPRFSGWRFGDELDDVRLFRGRDGWSALVVSRREDYDEDSGAVSGGQAVVETCAYADVAELRGDVERRWGSHPWWHLLDQGRERDPELYRLWVPERMERDLDRSSLYPRDLQPGLDPLEAMIARLEAAGWDVGGSRPAVTAAAARANRVVGGLVGRRYGWQAPIVVRVDDFGEVYARLADRREVRGQGLRELTEREREEVSERVRARDAAREASEGPGWERRGGGRSPRM